jgi:hypothetical protein
MRAWRKAQKARVMDQGSNRAPPEPILLRRTVIVLAETIVCGPRRAAIGIEMQTRVLEARCMRCGRRGWVSFRP